MKKSIVMFILLFFTENIGFEGKIGFSKNSPIFWKFSKKSKLFDEGEI